MVNELLHGLTDARQLLAHEHVEDARAEPNACAQRNTLGAAPFGLRRGHLADDRSINAIACSRFMAASAASASSGSYYAHHLAFVGHLQDVVAEHLARTHARPSFTGIGILFDR